MQPRGKVLVEEANPSFRRKDVCSIVMAEHIIIVAQARRQGGFEGVRSNPPFGPQKILYTLLYAYSTFLSALPVH